MKRKRVRELPILTDVVELHATGSFPKPERAPEPESPYAGGLLSEEDVAALGVAGAAAEREAQIGDVLAGRGAGRIARPYPRG